jgi:hypothetical protein
MSELDKRGKWDHLKVPDSPHQAKARESMADLRKKREPQAMADPKGHSGQDD